jgi:hypothetical protein
MAGHGARRRAKLLALQLAAQLEPADAGAPEPVPTLKNVPDWGLTSDSSD